MCDTLSVRSAGVLAIPGAGLEPARPCGQGILSPARLPFRHPGAAQCALRVLSYTVMVRATREVVP
jgi:hypothetical protein